MIDGIHSNEGERREAETSECGMEGERDGKKLLSVCVCVSN